MVDAPAPDARVRLRNGRVVDVVRGACLDGVDLVIRDGRIVAMPGLPGEPANPPVDFVVDLHGAVVTPGLVNAHCHLRLVTTSLFLSLADVLAARKHKRAQVARNLDDCLRHGVTTVRDAWSGDLRGNSRARRRIAGGEIPGPRIVQAVVVAPEGGAITPRRDLVHRVLYGIAGMDTPAYHEPHSGAVVFAPGASRADVRAAVDRAIDERGAEAIKLYDQPERMLTYVPGAVVMTQAQLDAAADQARKRGLPSMVHHVTADTFRRGVRAGVTTLDHVASDGPLDEADVAAFVAAGCTLTPTLSLAFDLDWETPGIPAANPGRLRRLSAFRDGAEGDLVREFWLPELRGAVTRGAARGRKGSRRILSLIDATGVLRYYGGVVSHGMDNVNRILDAGGCVAVGNDAGAVARTPAMVGLELALLGFCRAEAGATLTGAEALRAATLHGARALGLDRDRGSLETGKVADVAVHARDPLADPSAIGAPVAALFLDGRLAIDAAGLRFEPVA